MKKETRKLSKYDFIILGIFLTLYSILSFYQLGSFNNPNTFISGKEVILKIENQTYVSKIRFFTGHQFDYLKVYTSLDGKKYSELSPIQNIYVFSWNDIEIKQDVKYMKIIIPKDTDLGEIALYNQNHKMIDNINNIKNASLLLDEFDTIPKEINYYNSTYFDEIYFARTAYEYAKGLKAYEWVHPPLGKVIISIPIKLFCMAPFYYRSMTNIAGILMIAVLYVFSKRIFKRTKYALLPPMFLLLDGFHFAHTRMASIDAFLVLFLLLSFLFMYEYFCLHINENLKRKIFYLGLSGFFMGCAIATKWTAFFGLLALGIFFLLHFFKVYRINKKWNNQAKFIFIFCIFSFLIIPISLYILLYLLYPNMLYFHTGSISEIIDITKDMYTYHSNLKDDHMFYSPLYTWPIMWKPVWYYVNVSENLKSTISGFGNPIIWWFSSLSMIYIFYKALRKDKISIFIMITYICLLFSYIGIQRGMFLYHYFPAFPFTLLALTSFIQDVTKRIKNNYIYIGIIILSIFFFYYFFPVVSGMPTPSNIIENKKWLPHWYF